MENLPCDILAIGWAENNSGFSRVFNSIFERVCDTFKIVHFGINYKGPKLHHKWIVEPNCITADIVGSLQLEALLLKYNPKLIFFCHDYWLYDIHKELLQKYRLTQNTVFYCPVEFKLRDNYRVQIFSGIGKLVFYTQYGKDVFNQEMLETAEPETPSKSYDILPHGVDTNLFFPIQQTRQQLRRTVFQDRPELWEAFIILNANTNMDRKRIDLTLQAFAMFVKAHDANCYLCLHMCAIDSGTDLRNSICELGITDRVVFTGKPECKPAVDDCEMNLIYNACDIGVNTSDGEGWGLVAFEHAAVGKCQLVPDHTGCSELWKDSAVLIPVNNKNEVNVQRLSSLFSELYYNPALLAKHASLCYLASINKIYDWDKIVIKWKAIFLELMRD